jgi:hypothetical protein
LIKVLPITSPWKVSRLSAPASSNVRAGRNILSGQAFLDLQRHGYGRRPTFHAARNKGWDLAFD